MTPEQQQDVLSAGTEEILPVGELLERLQLCAREKRPLRVKQFEKAGGSLLITEKGDAAQSLRLLKVIDAEDLQGLLGSLILLPGFLDIGDGLHLRLAELQIAGPLQRLGLSDAGFLIVIDK